MRLEPTQRPDQVLRVSARLITSSNILHFSSDELERAIDTEQAENPVFEATEQRVCLFCGTRLHGSTCANCGHIAQFTATGNLGDPLAVRGSSHDISWSNHQQTSYDMENYGFTEVDSNDNFDPLAQIPRGETLAEMLLQQLEALISPDDAPIAEQLVGNLNERGYLEIGTDEIATYLQVPEERVFYVLQQLQTLEPPGIGARSLRECLLIQLQAVAEQSTPHPLAHTLIDQYLDVLGKNQFADIARALRVSEQEIRQASLYIGSTLHPFPAHIYHADIHNTGTTYVRPDVVIRRGEDGFEVELIEERRYHFTIKVAYSDVEQRAQTKSNDEVSRYMRQYNDRAHFFVDGIQRRWRTLKRVTEFVVDYQHEFLEKGVRYLRPLTRAEVASRLSLDEGTVSRATANKYALLPNGRLIPMSDFFDGSLGVKDVLRELIQAEQPRRRLSDEDLSRLMTARGIPMARRTVTKYREEMGIGSSRERSSGA